MSDTKKLRYCLRTTFRYEIDLKNIGQMTFQNEQAASLFSSLAMRPRENHVHYAATPIVLGQLAQRAYSRLFDLNYHATALDSPARARWSRDALVL
ncbi:hypothetical protein ABKN59_008237 [Abortiporus biennis]